MTTLYVTGFGKFGDVETNPTSEVLEYIRGEGISLAPEYCVKECIDVLHVSKKGIDEYFDTVHVSSNNISIHFGINSRSTCFNMERYAYNNMDFRIPDMCGDEPKMQCIDEGLILDYPRSTGFDLDDLINILQKEGFNVAISDDPGRYCCNYIYYKSLLRQDNIESKKGEKRSIFIHVPPFSVIDKDTQIAFVRRVVSLLCKPDAMISSSNKYPDWNCFFCLT